MGALKATITDFYRLTKPGIIYGNLLVFVGCYIFASRGSFIPLNLAGAAIGTGLIIACGCVLNNYIDQDIDRLMARTKKRALVSGNISDAAALVFGTLLGSIGLALLAATTNSLTVGLGVTGLVTYAGLYTYLKRRSVHATLVGTIPGAIPVLAGYAATTNRLDQTAWLLFATMVCWQMIHFYAIALRRLPDYKRAKIPVMPVVHGALSTTRHMLFYGLAFMAVTFALVATGAVSLPYGVIMPVLGYLLISDTARGLKSKQTAVWSRQVFLRSLIVLPVFSLLLALEPWLS